MCSLRRNIYYYVGGNTAAGFVNYLESNLQEVNNIIVLSHPSLRLKTEVVKQAKKHFEANEPVEVICSAFGSEFLDGIIVRESSIAILTDDIVKDKDLHQVTTVDLTEGNVSIGADEEAELTKEDEYRRQSYRQFKEGLEIHDQLEKIYIDEMDFKKADEVADQFIEDLLRHVREENTPSVFYKRLFGTNTEAGSISVVPELIESITNRFYIKGRAGTGKSVFMKKVMAACEDKGLDMEVYHCSFDPNSIDMVIIRSLDVCLFDSTDPHEFFPERIGDTVIDLYEEAVAPGTDEKFAQEIANITKKYKSYMKQGISSIKRAYEYRELIEERYDSLLKQGHSYVKEKILPLVK